MERYNQVATDVEAAERAIHQAIDKRENAEREAEDVAEIAAFPDINHPAQFTPAALAMEVSAEAR